MDYTQTELGTSSQASYYPPTAPVHPAFVQWKPLNRKPKLHRVWLTISTSVRWKRITSATEVVPQKLEEFRGQYCLDLDRLHDNAEWKDLESAVKEVETENGPGLVISGKISVPGVSLPRSCQVTIGTESFDTRNAWVKTLRIYKAPYQLLYRQMNMVLLNSSMPQNSLRDYLLNEKRRLESIRGESSSRTPSNCTYFVERTSPIAEVSNAVSATTDGIIACLNTFTPMCKDMLEEVADLTKCITILGPIFQVALLCAKLGDMACEMKRAAKEWSLIHSDLSTLEKIHLQSMDHILHPDGKMNAFLVKNMFEVREEIFNVLTKVENAIMLTNPIVKYWKVHELKAIEAELNSLKSRVLGVVQSGSLAETKKDLKELTLEVRQGTALGMRAMPKLVSHFVGRKKEILKLRSILEEYSSAAVMQYGGVGKTQLAVAFCQEAEREGWVSKGVTFWIRADGDDKEQVIEQVADFTERLTEKTFCSEDRKDSRIVFAALKQKLNDIKGKWLLVIDNADCSTSNVIYARLAGFGSSYNGWVLLTSRQNRRTMIDGIGFRQKLFLGPLHVEDAMIALLQFKEDCVFPEEEKKQKLIEFQSNDPVEYNALFHLAGNVKDYGLDGLPLALAQAGSSIRRYKITFSKYVKLYEDRRQSADVRRVFDEIEDSGLERAHQRTIWTTWTINTEQLSGKAWHVLVALACLACSVIPRGLLEHQNLSFSNESLEFLEIIDELLGANLIQECDADSAFSIHRLIREFILVEAKLERDSTIRSALDCAIHALYCNMKEELEISGSSINEPSFPCAAKVRVLLPHAMHIVHRFSENSSTESDKLSSLTKVASLAKFTVQALMFQGRVMEASSVCSSWHKLLIVQYGKDSNNVELGSAFRDMGTVSLSFGSLDEAEKWFRRSLEVRKRIYGEDVDHLEIASSLHGLGLVTQELGQLDEAEKFFLQSLAMREKIYGSDVDNAEIASTLHQLGVISEQKSRLREADQYYHRSLEIEQNLYGINADHGSIAKSLHQLGIVNQSRGLWDAAKSYFRRSLEMNLRIHGENADHPEISKSLHHMGQIAQHSASFMHELNRFGDEKELLDEAEGYYHISLDMTHRLIGEDTDHLDIATSFHQLGMLAEAKLSIEEARGFYHRSLEMKMRILGDDANHPDIASTLHQLGRVAWNLDELEQARKYFRRSLEMEKRIHGNEDHQDVATSLADIGIFEIEEGEKAKGMRLLLQGFEMMHRVCGDSHPNVLKLENYLKEYDEYQGSEAETSEVLGDGWNDEST